MNKKIGLVWLHNDLRIHDNSTLVNASKYCDELLILYATYDFPRDRGQSYHFNGLGVHRQRFLQESLSDLSGSLKSLGNQLLFAEKLSLTQLVDFMKVHEVTDVFYSHSADYDHQCRHELVIQRLPNLRFHESRTATLFDDLPMLALPKVFTAFREHIEKDCYLLRQSQPIAQVETPNRLPPMPKRVNQALIYQSVMVAPTANADSFIGGETQALMHCETYFKSDAPSTYKETRSDLEDWQQSTKFSAWLANGTLSARTIIHRLREYEQQVIQNESTYWIWFELLWREYFYWYAHTHEHKLFTYKGITPCKNRSCFYGERFERWKQGNTPYPIVNACMNQLRETGYLSNRGRQIVASCFVHELGMDWRYGACYFEQQLIDYDVASNWGNWQYIAGVGADPRGGRQFNLQKQTKQHDPEGKFIAKWNGDVGATQIDSVDAADWPII